MPNSRKTQRKEKVSDDCQPGSFIRKSHQQVDCQSLFKRIEENEAKQFTTEIEREI